jgi:hypothetical protein
MIERSMSSEVHEELNLQRDEYKITPLAFAREIYRGESPQLFCLITTELSCETLTERFNSIAEQSREFDSFEFLSFDNGNPLDREQLAAFNHESRMNYYLAEEYLSNS